MTALTFNVTAGARQTILNQDSQSTTVNVWNTDNSSNWKIEGEFTYFENLQANAGSFVAAGSHGPGIMNGIICAGSAVYARFSAYTLTILGGFVDNDVIRFTLERVGNTVTFEANGFSESLTTSNTFFTSFIGFGNDMHSDINQYRGQIQGTWRFSGGGLATRTYVLDNQNTGAGTVILVDETSGFNLLSDDMATDGSVWVDTLEPSPDPEPDPEPDPANPMRFDTETAIQSQGITVDENNKLTSVGTSSVRGTRSFTGKSYCEFVLEKGHPEVFFGLIRESAADMANYTFAGLTTGDAALIYPLTNPDSVYGTPFVVINDINTNTSVNDVIGIAIDTNTGDVWFSVNGSWATHEVTPEEAPDPSTGTSPNFSGYPADAWTIFAEVRIPDTEITCRSTYDSLSYEVPQGFTVLGLAETPNPDGELYSFTYTLPTLQDTLSGFVLQMKESDFPPLALDGSPNSIEDGQTLRAYLDSTKAVRLPMQVVKCITGQNPEVLIYVRIPTVSTGSSIYFIKETGTQPANDEPYGRNEVWSDYWIVTHDCYSEDDETGNVSKSYVAPIERKVEGQTIAGGFDCGSHDDNFVTTYRFVDKLGNPLSVGNEFTVQAWGNINTTSTDTLGQGLVTLYDQGINDSARLMADNNPNDWGIYDTEDSWLRSGQPQELGEFKNSVMTYDSTQRKIYYQGNKKAEADIVSPLDPFDSGWLFIGRGRQLNGQELWDGEVSDVRMSKQPLSDARVKADFENMNSETSWGTYSEWLLPTIINKLQYGGQTVVDVKYSDENSILQSVQMYMGSLQVWGAAPEPQPEWGLQFDGNNDYMTYPIVEIAYSRDFVIKLTAEFKASTMLLGNDIDTLSYIYCNSTGKITAKIEDGSGDPVAQVYSASSFQEGQVVEVELRRVVNILTILVDGVAGDSITNRKASNFNTIGSWGNSALQPLFYSGMMSGIMSFEGPALPTRTYDFNFSGNAQTGSGQPVLIDTTSGLNATGFGMSTDDSNWVELT